MHHDRNARSKCKCTIAMHHDGTKFCAIVSCCRLLVTLGRTVLGVVVHALTLHMLTRTLLVTLGSNDMKEPCAAATTTEAAEGPCTLCACRDGQSGNRAWLDGCV